MNQSLYDNITTYAKCVVDLQYLLDCNIITPKEYRRLFKLAIKKFKDLGVDL